MNNCEEESYWNLLHSGSDSGWDSMDNNLEAVLNLIPKLITQSNEFDNHSGKIVTFELFADIIELYSELISIESDSKYKKYQKCLFLLQSTIVECYNYIDEWDEESDQQLSKSFIKNIYCKWITPLTESKQESKPLETIQFHLNNRIREKQLDLGIKDLNETREVIKKLKIDNIVNSLKSQDRNKSILIIHLILDLIIKKEIVIDYSKFSDWIKHLEPNYNQISLWKDYQKLINPTKTKKPIIPNTISISGRLGPSRADLIALINKSKLYNYNTNKSNSHFVLIGVDPSFNSNDLSSEQVRIGLLELLDMIEK
ncbi:MAG: hypothetical protein ACRCXZ_08900 [Patescibacteria group bacterium]